MTQPSEKLTHGFLLEREQAIPELSALARVYRHAKTGGRLLSIISPDENKVFGIALRTPRRTTPAGRTSESTASCAARTSTRSRSPLWSSSRAR